VSSSDWLSLLLERPGDGAVGARPLSWLPELTEPASGFVDGLPFGRSLNQPKAEPEKQSSVDLDQMTGDELVDILHEALGESEQKTGEAESEPEPTPDPVAEALARGEEAGKRAAMAELEGKAQQKLSLRQTFRTLDQAAMDALARELAETVITLCVQTLNDYTPDAANLQERCHQAAQRLGGGASGAALHLHPDDLALLDENGLGDWKVVGDPGAERGGLRFETQDGSISDRPSDWRRAIAAAIRG